MTNAEELVCDILDLAGTRCSEKPLPCPLNLRATKFPDAAFMSLNQLEWIDLPRFEDARGILTSLEVVPFEVRNAFFLHSVVSERGGHAHRATRQLIVPVAGSFHVHASDGCDSADYALSNSHRALHVPPMHWLRLHDFTASAVCLVLTDSSHDDADYLRDWDEFVALSRAERMAR